MGLQPAARSASPIHPMIAHLPRIPNPPHQLGVSRAMRVQRRQIAREWGHTYRLWIMGITGLKLSKPLIVLAQSKEDFGTHLARNRGGPGGDGDSALRSFPARAAVDYAASCATALPLNASA